MIYYIYKEFPERPNGTLLYLIFKDIKYCNFKLKYLYVISLKIKIKDFKWISEKELKSLL